MNGVNRYRPIGDGVFVANDSDERIAFHQQDGHMRFFDAESILPADRIGYFEQNRWLQLIFAVAAFAAAWSVAAAVRRLILRDRRGRAASLVVDGLCVIWLAAGAMLAVALWPWFEDPNSAVFTYPEVLYPRRAGRCLRRRSRLHWPQLSLSVRCVPPTGADGSGSAARRR